MSTLNVEQKVRKHFDIDAPRFDAIYHPQKSLLGHWIDDVWRGVVSRRLSLTLERLAPFDGKRILDVGCGSGRYCVAYAQAGAAHVMGVDFAPAMIELAQRSAQQLGVADRCEFRVGTFPEAVADGTYDACSAMGFFDYVADPLAMILHMRELTRETVVMSFPKAFEWRVPIRRMRFWMNGCPLFLYTERRVRQLLEQAWIERYDWIVLDRDYVVVAHL